MPHMIQTGPTRRSHFAIIANAAMRDPRLSWGAKGLLATMLTYADGWKYHQSHLATLTTDGKHATRSAIQELIKAGYVTQERGQGEWNYTVRDTPVAADDTLMSDNQICETQTSENLPLRIPSKQEDQEELQPLSATPTSSLKTSPASSEEPVEVLVAMWNEHRGVLPSVKTVPPARRKKLTAFVRTAGGMKEALETLRRATLVVAADSHWRNGKYGLDNLLAGDKVFARAEQYEAQHTVEVAPAGVAVGEAVVFYVMAGNLRVPMTGRVLEVTDAQVVIEEASHGREYRVPFRDVRRS
jgi:hypothetical protein